MKKLSLILTIAFGVAVFSCQEQDDIKPKTNAISEPTPDDDPIEMGTQRGKTTDPYWN